MRKQELTFPKKNLQEKAKNNAKDFTISNRPSFLARKKSSDLPPPSSTIHLEEQSCTRKDTTSLCESKATPDNDKKSDKPIKDYQKGIELAANVII